jgi:predicted membrane chloride channel (bestrophin family)
LFFKKNALRKDRSSTELIIQIYYLDHETRMILRQTQNNKEARLFIKQILIDKIEKKNQSKRQ